LLKNKSFLLVWLAGIFTSLASKRSCTVRCWISVIWKWHYQQA
jgi:hypothetical protein